MVDITEHKPITYMRQNHFDKDRMAGSVPIWGQAESNNKPAEKVSHLLSATQSEHGTSPTQGPSLSFGELLDVINPLQHIPVVNKLYQSLTGDTASSMSQIVGGMLYGGVLGGTVSIMNAAMEEQKSNASLTAFNLVDDERTAGSKEV